MSDLISRSALLRIINTMTFDRRFLLVKHLIEATPTVDTEPVQHGKWEEIVESATGHLMECSVCKEWIFHNFNYASNYCPNCGAKMDAEVEG